MTNQLAFSFLKDYLNIKPRFTAIYFFMGQHEALDNQDRPELVGLDCPFDDSLVIEAWTEKELDQKIFEIYAGEKALPDSDLTSCYPDIICDSHGTIQIELYRRICLNPEFEPAQIFYSGGRESLIEFWNREKWRWFPE